MAEKTVMKPAEQTFRYPDKVPEIYAEGAAFVFGWPNSKLVLNSTVPKPPGDSSTPSEQRDAVLVLTLPTAVLIELCRNLLGAAVGASDQLKIAAQAYYSNVEAILGNVAGASASGGTQLSAAMPRRQRSATKHRGRTQGDK